MQEFDLENMSLDELKKLQKDVTKAIETYQERQRKEALAAVEAKAREMGFTLSELAGDAKAPKSRRSALPPKYAHPDNPSLTWSGRGRQPAWFKEAIDAGRSPEDFLIKK